MDSDLYVAVNSEDFTAPFCVYLISKGVAGRFLSVSGTVAKNQGAGISVSRHLVV